MKSVLFVVGAALAVVAWGDVEIGPKDGFAAVKGTQGARLEKTRDSLVFTDIQYDMQVTCRIKPLFTSSVTGFEFRYRVTGPTTRPRAGGEGFSF